MELLKRAKDKFFWQQIRTDKKYAALIAGVKEIYKKSRTQPVAPLSDRARQQFKINGSRHEFEKQYFMRRQYLTSAALLALIYPEENGYLSDLQDVISATLDEFSWALPAHTANACDLPEETCIDLFAAETGFSLAEICYLVSDGLGGELTERIKAEAERRIINSYLTRSFGWETDRGNWAAVCGGCVAGTFLYLAPERFHLIAERIDHTINCFLQSFTEEGVCEEGLAYWQYGFGTFVWFAELLLQFTDGKKDYFASAKVEKIAAFAQKSFLCGNQVVSFSDSTRDVKVHGALMSFLSDKYPKSVHTLPAALTSWICGDGISTEGNWIRCIRDFVYFDLSDKEGRLEERSYDFILSGQVIVNCQKYSLAVKANHNGEPHNHNDVGTFILSTEEGQIFCDLGAGQYSGQYFSAETRYGFLCNSSRGHSVPVINGAYQRAGKEYHGSIAHAGNEITVEMAGAYGQKNLKSATRKFRYFENRIELCDAFSAQGGEYTERFVTLFEPKLFEGYAVVGNVKLLFEESVSVSVSTEEHALHNAGGESETTYLLDFALKKGTTSARFVFEIL